MAAVLTASPRGQNHDPLDPRDESSVPSLLMDDSVDGRGEPVDITPFQKMVSATTGSLLTGLTSTSYLIVNTANGEADN